MAEHDLPASTKIASQATTKSSKHISTEHSRNFRSNSTRANDDKVQQAPQHRALEDLQVEQHEGQCRLQQGEGEAREVAFPMEQAAPVNQLNVCHGRVCILGLDRHRRQVWHRHALAMLQRSCTAEEHRKLRP